MGDDLSEAELANRVNKALEAYALKKGAKSHIWICVTDDNGPVGGCSPNLRPYGPGLMDEVEKATSKRIVVTDGALQPNLLTAEQVFTAAAKTKHVEIHPIVALLINGMNELNNHKIPRINALTDPSTVPDWFPFMADKYAARAQKMDLSELFKVMDVVFAQIRGDLPKIKKLHSMLENVFKSGCCSIGTRAAVDAFFDFLTQDAMQPVVTEALSGLFRKRLQSEMENGVGGPEKRRRAEAGAYEGREQDKQGQQGEAASNDSPDRQWSGPSDTSTLSFLWPFEDSLQSPALVQRMGR